MIATSSSTKELRKKVLVGMCLTLGPIALILGITNILLFTHKSVPLGTLEIGYFLLSMYMLYSVRKKKILSWFLDLHVIILTILSVGWAYINVSNGSSMFIWSISLPIIYYLSLGKKKGLLYSTLCFAIALLTVHKVAQMDYIHGQHLYFNFIFSYILSWGISHVYEVNREKTAIALEVMNSSLVEESINLTSSLQRTELELLRMQTNPHFLFNTLNLISGEIPNRPQLAQEVLFDLSDLLRGTIYAAGKKRIQLKEEISLIEHYLSIQSVRYDQRLAYKIDLSGGGLTKLVPPMLIITLVENVIKHVVSKSNRHIDLKVTSCLEDDKLTIAVQNTALEKQRDTFKQGTGHENIIKTLDLEYGNADFSIKTFNGLTHAVIAIDLSSYKDIDVKGNFD